jgi:hypothetical protein
MCIGTSAGEYEHYAPELEDKHLKGISFNKTNYLMPWALYTISPGSIHNGRVMGELTDEGKKLVKMSLIRLLKD